MQHTSKIASLDSLQGQRRNQSSTYTTTIFGSKNLNRIFLFGIGLLGPVKNLAKSLGTSGLEVRVLVEDRSICTDVACLVVLLLADGSNAAGRKASGTSSNKFGQSSNKLQLWPCASNTELVVEEIKGLLQVLKGIPIGVLVSAEDIS